MSGFDFAAFRAAFEARDAARWLAFYAPDAEWLEYRASNPPRAPNVMRGRDEIGAFLRGVAASPVEITIENEVIDGRRAAFTIIVEREDGRRIVENIIIDHRDGLVVRQIDVEAWD
jgi:ketosteroid isomerase-like protein